MLKLTPKGQSTLPLCERCRNARFGCRVDDTGVFDLHVWCTKGHYDVTTAEQLRAAMRHSDCSDYVSSDN